MRLETIGLLPTIENIFLTAKKAKRKIMNTYISKKGIFVTTTGNFVTVVFIPAGTKFKSDKRWPNYGYSPETGEQVIFRSDAVENNTEYFEKQTTSE